MKTGLSIFCIIILCALMVSMEAPLSCLANSNRIEFEDEIGAGETIVYRRIEIGKLNKGDKVKIVIENIRGESGVEIHLTTHKRFYLTYSGIGVLFSFPGEKEITVPEDGVYYLLFTAVEKAHVLYKGYVEW